MSLIEDYLVKDAIEGDVIALSESIVAITQKRVIPIDKVQPSFLARVLYPWVSNVNYGVGLRSPQSMQIR